MRLFLLVPALTALTTALGFAIDVPWVLPVLNAIPAWAILYLVLRRGERGRVIGLMVWWALWLALSTIAATLLWNGRAEGLILNAAPYRDEMFDWLRTGTGRESSPSQFIPQHLLHAGIFCALSLATGSLVSIFMGAVLMNYMSFYVGDLILQCWGGPGAMRAVALAWNPWSMVRVVSFIILGVALSEPLLGRLKGSWPGVDGRLRWVGIGLAGLALDIVLKALLAPWWPQWLSVCVIPS